MRRLGLVLAVLIVIACSAATIQAALSPPALPVKAAPNSVATFPCPPNPASTVEIEACQAQQLLRLDRDFNKQAAVLWSLLDRPGRRAFVRAHRAWLTYRDQECEARARSRLGGTALPVVYGQCQTELTAARVKEVKSTLTYYCDGRVKTGPRRSCPHSTIAAPHYKSCGAVNDRGERIRVYASQVSCSTALTVDRRCRAANCFGQLPLLTTTNFDLPEPPTSQPLGFRCWQVYGRYAAGLPWAPALPARRDNFLILCDRETGKDRSTGLVLVRQLVAWSQ